MTPAEQAIDDLKYLASTVAGRRIFATFLRTSGVWHSSFLRAGQQQKTTEFCEGMRHMGLMLYNDLQAHCFENLILLLRESNNETHEPGEPDIFSS
jgi:hypothetical protein